MLRSFVLLSVVAACGPVKGTPPEVVTDGANPDTAQTAGFTVSVLTSNVTVPLDGNAALDLAITRTGGFEGEITVGGITLPNGITVTPLTVAADANTAELLVGAASPLAIGDTVDFDLESTAAGVDPRTTSISEAEITGKPGSLDVSFGVGTGYASIGFGNDDGGSFNALDVLGGNIITTGIGVAGLGPTRFSTMRFTAAGAVDTTFNGGVLVRTVFNSGSTNESGFSAAVGHQLDGRPILIGAHHGKTPTQDLAVARLSTTGGGGGVDFGNDVAAHGLYDLSGGQDTINDGLVLADGRIVAVGETGGHHTIAIVQANGSGLDGGFNTTGKFRDVLGNASTARAVAVDANNRLVVVGSTSNAGSSDLTIHRYTTIGLDSTFGTGGRVTVAVPTTNESPIGLAVLSTGKIVVANVSETNFQLRRFNTDGTPDTTFGTNGVAETPSGGAGARDMVVMPDGKIVVLAQSGNDAVLMRFKANGVLDPLFGANGSGSVTVPYGDTAEVNAMIVYDGQKVVIAGGNQGGVPGPGSKGLIARIWM